MYIIGICFVSCSNVFPLVSDLSQLLSDIVESSNWKSLIILYETQEYLSLAQKILERSANILYPNVFKVLVKQLKKIGRDEYRINLQELQQYDCKNILILSSVASIEDILKQAQQG